MRINIPQKLEKYKDHIKKSSYKVVYSQRFSFLKIGLTNKNDTFRELYLCYNPYDVDVRFDINYFKEDKNIYKLYPPDINVKSGEIFAFMVFSTEKSDLEFDSDILMYNKKNRINNLINKINEKNNILNLNMIVEDYNPDVNSTIMLDGLKIEETTKVSKLEIDKTQYLGDIDTKQEPVNEIVYEPYNSENYDVKVKLEDILYKKGKYEFILKFINTNLNKNYQLSGMDLKLVDKKLKKSIAIELDIKLKNYSMKEISLTLSESKLKDFMMSDIKIDVVVY